MEEHGGRLLAPSGTSAPQPSRERDSRDIGERPSPLHVSRRPFQKPRLHFSLSVFRIYLRTRNRLIFTNYKSCCTFSRLLLKLICLRYTTSNTIARMLHPRQGDETGGVRKSLYTFTTLVYMFYSRLPVC